MKRTIIAIALVFGAAFLFAQSNVNKLATSIKLEKNKIIQEALSLQEIYSAVKDEYILDSIVYYAYPDVGDSIPWEKTEFIHFENSSYHRFDYVWDEEIGGWMYTEKEEFTFDEDGNLVEWYRSYWWPTPELWVPDRKFIMEYNDAGLEILFIFQKWDEGQQELKNFYKNEYTYNDDNQATGLWDYFWDENSSEWIGSYHTAWEYSATGLLELKQDYAWNEGIQDWEVEYKMEYTYDTNGFLIKTDGYNMGPISGEWSHDHKTDYINNTLGNPTVVLGSHSQDNGMTWTNGYQNEITYLNDYLQILNIGSEWNPINQAWDNSTKSEFDWDSNENMILDQRFDWDESQNDWFLYHKTERLYNENGVLLEWADYSFDLTWQQFVGIAKIVRVMNEVGNPIIRYEYDWDLSISDWKLKKKGYYYYTFSTSIDENQAHDLLIVGNPISSELMLRHNLKKTTDYRIYSVQGKLVQAGSLGIGETSIKVAELDSGSYILQLDSGKGPLEQVFIKN